MHRMSSVKRQTSDSCGRILTFGERCKNNHFIWMCSFPVEKQTPLLCPPEELQRLKNIIDRKRPPHGGLETEQL